jgi:iron complex transport system substrate-binding protein
MKRQIKHVSIFFAVVMILAVFAGCVSKAEAPVEAPVEEPVVAEAPKEAGTAFPVDVIDYNGNIVTIEEEPQTIVSLAPANTEVLFALGLGDKMVGVTEYCDFPEAALAVDKVGDFNGPNIEMIIEKMPDLIVSAGYMHEEAQATFEELGIIVLPIEAASFDNVYTSIENIAKATGTTDAATVIIEEMKTAVDEVKAKTANAEKKKVFYALDTTGDEIWTVAQGTFIDDIITMVGGENIATGETPWTTISSESIIEANPDVIIVPPFGADISIFSEDSAYVGITAVKEEQYVILPDVNVISRGGPRLIEAIYMMGEAIQPGIFQ